MAILGKIRERSIFLILVIGMALFAFVISGVFDGGSGSGFETRAPIGEVDGEELSIAEFRNQVDFSERNFNMTSSQAVENVWNQMLRSTILQQEFEALGLGVGKSAIELVLSENPNFNSDTRFQNEIGQFDVQKFIDFLAELKATNPIAFEQWSNQEESLKNSYRQTVYQNLLKAGLNATEKDGEYAFYSEGNTVNIQYVQIPYSSIPDSLVSVTKKDIKNYIEEHPSDFEVEASRDIQYVLFEESPSLEDENAIKSSLEELLQEKEAYNDVSKLTETLPSIKSTKNISEFINEYSDIKFDSIYVAKGALPTAAANTLFALPEGEVFGPYLDNGYYKLSRMLDRKKGGSVRASHILVSYQGASNAASDITRSKAAAKAEAQRLLRKARNNPSTFSDLAKEFSDGPSKTKGGDLGFFQEGAMVPNFNDFVFSNRNGKIGMVETDFGFHVIQITGKEDVVLLATVARKLVPSEETSNLVFNQATKFEIAAQKEVDFVQVAEENKYSVRPVKNLKVLDNNLPGLENQRRLVQWAFSEEAQVGDIKRFNVNSGGYVVAQLTNAVEEGLSPLEEALARVTPILRNQQKAAYILDNYSDNDTLEAFASANNITVNSAAALNTQAGTLSGAGREPLIVGTAFSMSENEVSELLKGQNGVYKIKVTQSSKAAPIENYTFFINQEQEKYRSNIMSKVFTALKDSKEVIDNRAEYY
jgi:peptidyl-prolyl cis-trans isomerase D